MSDEPHLYDGLTAFATSTWLRPKFNFLPQLMMGKHETGKTRLLTTIARIAHRGRVPVSFTPAAILRTVDKYHITLFLSEYHNLNPDLRDEVNAVIKGSQKRGGDVMWTEKGPEGGYEPANFNIFTHSPSGRSSTHWTTSSPGVSKSRPSPPTGTSPSDSTRSGRQLSGTPMIDSNQDENITYQNDTSPGYSLNPIDPAL